ncbi:hypothetical protein SynA15127_00384 [Synechococcus sp. A15-127]|nr:hypothetical protein SynA15127_00384 [Synechococcus sp. A15-127]
MIHLSTLNILIFYNPFSLGIKTPTGCEDQISKLQLLALCF